MTARIKVRNLGQFNRKIQKWGKVTVPQQFSIFHKRVAMEVFTRIVMRTPVGNPALWSPQSLPPPPGYVGGRARGNWQMQFLVRNSRETGAIDPSGAATIAKGAANIRFAPPFGVFRIFNNVPYIRRLEEGYSYKQAPIGMVLVTLAEVGLVFRR